MNESKYFSHRLHDLSNRYHAADVTTPVSFPDINPSRRPENFQFQMVPGDFLDVSQNLVMLNTCIVRLHNEPDQFWTGFMTAAYHQYLFLAIPADHPHLY